MLNRDRWRCVWRVLECTGAGRVMEQLGRGNGAATRGLAGAQHVTAPLGHFTQPIHGLSCDYDWCRLGSEPHAAGLSRGWCVASHSPVVPLPGLPLTHSGGVCGVVAGNEMHVDARGFLHSTAMHVPASQTAGHGAHHAGSAAATPSSAGSKGNTKGKATASGASGSATPLATHPASRAATERPGRKAFGKDSGLVELNFGNGHTQQRIIRSTGLPHSHDTELTAKQRELELQRASRVIAWPHVHRVPPPATPV